MAINLDIRSFDDNVYQRINYLNAQHEFFELLKILDQFKISAIEQNDTWFLNFYYDYMVYAALPGYTKTILEYLHTAFQNSHNHDYLLATLKLLSRINHSLGETSATIEYSTQVLEYNPDDYEALQFLIYNGRTPDVVKKHQKTWKNRNKHDNLSVLGFALYELAEREKKPAAEKILLEANLYTNKLISRSTPPSYENYGLREILDKENTSNITPVFVTGLPRSGSSLIEQQLGRTSGVRPLGECNYLRMAVSDAGCDAFFNDISVLPEHDYHSVSNMYFRQLTSRGYEDQYVIDKSLSNIRHVQLIRNIFPESPVLICQRPPVKNALSIFRKHFHGYYPNAYDLHKLSKWVYNTNSLIDQYKLSFSDDNKVFFINMDDYIQNDRGRSSLIEKVFNKEASIKSQQDEIIPIFTSSAGQANLPVSPSQVHKGELLPKITRTLENNFLNLSKTNQQKP